MPCRSVHPRSTVQNPGAGTERCPDDEGADDGEEPEQRLGREIELERERLLDDLRVDLQSQFQMYA